MKISRKKISKVAVLAVGLTLAVTAQAKREDEAFSQQAAPMSGDLASTVATQGQTIATVSNQVNEMVSRFQTMDGDIGREEKKNMDQDKILKDSQIRLQTLEDKMAVLTQQLDELKTEGLLKPATSQRLDEFKNYSKALEFVNAKNYAKAISELQNFQNVHKKSVFNTYAQYWIGEAYYLQSDYEMAIAEFQKLLTKDTKSAKAPAALYKQGLSFYYLQSFEDAKEFFSKVIRNYPQSIEAVQSSSQIARINNILDLRKQEEIEHQDVQSTM